MAGPIPNAKRGSTRAAGKVALPRGPLKLVKNAALHIQDRDGSMTPVKASLSNGTLFAHPGGSRKERYSVSFVNGGEQLRGHLSKGQAERIVRGTATHTSARKLESMAHAMRTNAAGQRLKPANYRTLDAFIKYANKIGG